MADMMAQRREESAGDPEEGAWMRKSCGCSGKQIWLSAIDDSSLNSTNSDFAGDADHVITLLNAL